ncbi:MAG: hypothetical protein ACC628_02095 [Pirellulaceae bacterium]
MVHLLADKAQAIIDLAKNHAVHAFIEGLFNAEVVATADTGRNQPRALFVFAGPPGAGKTFLAELAP